MKSITKKVVALSATFAMAASVAASAAATPNVTVEPGATAESITVRYTGLASDAQATILVYEGEKPFVNEKGETSGDNVGYINQDAATGSFTFAMRDTLVPAAGTQKTYNVKIGGTDVAVAGSTTFTLGEEAQEGFTATFEDDGVAAGDAITGTTITLPAITNKSPLTRYYTGWTKDGGTTVLAAGTEVELTENTKFTAVHFAKGDTNKDGSVNATDASNIYLFEADQYEIILQNCAKFWDDSDKSVVCGVADTNDDSTVNATDASNIYLYEADQYEMILTNSPKFWE